MQINVEQAIEIRDVLLAMSSRLFRTLREPIAEDFFQLR